MKHTPGPWWYAQTNDNKFAAGVGDVELTKGLRPEDARLIAAAPDLLAIAILVTESGLIPEWSGLGKSARAAIAKARGEK